MAKKSSSTIVQEELYPYPDEPARDEREEIEDARLLDLDVEQESPFLRAQKRVSVRRGSLPKKTTRAMRWAAVAAAVLLVLGIAGAATYHYGEESWRFRIDSSDQIEVAGLQNVTRSQVMEVMGGDIGRNIFFVPLDQRQKQLEQIPWVESASVMRFVPNRLKIQVHERTPVAFARVGSRIYLVDHDGTLMDLPSGKRKYSFPVILGMNSGEPHSTRAARMKTYNDLLSELDSGGAHYSQDLSEVDISDPDDVKVLANNAGSEVLIHLGSSDFLDRYKIYVTHVQDWRQQFEKLESVDLRYDRQIIVNPDLQGSARQAPLSASATKAAVAAGVRPAALVTREAPAPRSATATVKVAARAKLQKAVAKKKSKAVHRTEKTKHSAAVRKPATGDHAAAVKSTDARPSTSSANIVTAKSSGKPSPAIPKAQQ